MADYDVDSVSCTHPVTVSVHKWSDDVNSSNIFIFIESESFIEEYNKKYN